MTQIVQVRSLLEIDFEALHAANVTHLQTDIESTIAPYGVCEVDPAISDYLNTHRDLGHISTISLITNKTDVAFVDSIAEQLGGDIAYFYPRSASERKPSSALVERAAHHVHAHLGTVAVAGDKLTADMAAARRAGAAVGFWVKRLGRQDHIGDRVFRRNYERLTGRRFRLPKSPIFDQT